ncbi:hypothetical protein BSKO_02276 [Bryopsis sp. KO-2023]|nr:hypothetical protein BSKO_02276 [Bryopsis sp. KO-2023]
MATASVLFGGNTAPRFFKSRRSSSDFAKARRAEGNPRRWSTCRPLHYKNGSTPYFNPLVKQQLQPGGGGLGGNFGGFGHGGGGGGNGDGGGSGKGGGESGNFRFFFIMLAGISISLESRANEESDIKTTTDKKKSKTKSTQPITITLCSFAVTRMAYSRITRMFRKYYKEQTGRDVRFRLSFGGSGVQARAVIDGLPADMVALALPLDIIKIEEAGLINSDWRSRVRNDAVVAESVVAVVVREGNPKNIQDWDDLVKDGVKIVTSNPKTAGGARWNFLALWGHKMNKGTAAAKEYVTDVFRNVPVQPRDSREASDVFYKQKVGDALLTYENEVCMTNEMVGSDEALPYVVPKKNICVHAPVAIVDKNVDEKPAEVREAAEAFIDYLFTPEAQREFVNCGFRSVIPSVKKETVDKFPKVKTLWTVEKKLGGWVKSQQTFFDNGKILDDIQNAVGGEKMAAAKAAAA